MGLSSHEFHPFEPVFDSHSRVLILGSFPSVRSRETGFYYGHPQNRFWHVLSALYDEVFPVGNDSRRELVLRHGIALWDAIESCDIVGSSDASIRNAVPSHISPLLVDTSIRRIFCNGRRAFDLYNQYCASETGMSAILLPSTSAANAAWSLEKLKEVWSIIL